MFFLVLLCEKGGGGELDSQFERGGRAGYEERIFLAQSPNALDQILGLSRCPSTRRSKTTSVPFTISCHMWLFSFWGKRTKVGDLSEYLGNSRIDLSLQHQPL